MLIKGLGNPVIDVMMKLSPSVICLFFGQKNGIIWQKVFSPPIFTKIIDLALRILFGWDCRNICQMQKAIGYLVVLVQKVWS